MDEKLLEDLVAANRILAEHGVIDAYGHVSMRSPRDPLRFILARNIAPETVQAEDLLESGLDGEPVDAARKSDSVTERYIHSEVYRARPEVMAVVHNHSPSVVPFSFTNVPMRALYHMAAFVGEGVPNFEIRPGTQTPAGRGFASLGRPLPAARLLYQRHELAYCGALVRHRQVAPVEALEDLVLLEAIDQNIEQRGVFR